MIARLLPCFLLALFGVLEARVAALELTHGPWLGATDEASATVWVRTDSSRWLTLEAWPEGSPDSTRRAFFHTGPADDFAVSMRLGGLTADTRYTYRVLEPGEHEVARGSFRTTSDRAATTRIAFCSCADEDADTRAVWPVLAAQNPEALVLLGDTPYIDSTRLDVQRRRYREFAAVDELQALVARVPTFSTWDDHDVGRNDTDGNLAGKENARIAFCDYRPNPSFGDGSAGIYTRFRRGPVEVFLLDTRTFANTDDTPHADGTTSALGAAQWHWLLEGLATSTAAFKVLACGMIWNGAVRPGKQDHWGSYREERDRLLGFVARERIHGVVLVGGDIHRSRALKHEVRGLTVHELIVSPLHDRIIQAANAPHPGLLADFGKPHSFLLLDATLGETPRLEARLVDETGAPYYDLTIFE